jgi:serine/threonine protein phosphatase PrpC
VRGVRARARELEGADAAECAELLEAVDRELVTQRHGGEATAVVVVVRGSEVVGASVGDSGAWLVGPSGARELTGRQVRKPFVGVGSATATGFHAVLRADERLLVASDGLLKHVDRERIVAAGLSGPLAGAARCLVELARLPSGGLQDDVAVVLWEP